MTKRTELAICAYTLAVVLLAFCQVMHEVYDVPNETSPTAVLMARTEVPR